MRYLTIEEIIRLNKLTISRHGGHYVPPHNLLRNEALEYLVGIVESELFGDPLYPTVAEKAAVYMFQVISNHIFQDGNKRTGLAAALSFAWMNGFELAEDLEGKGRQHKEIVYNFTLSLAAAEIPLPACQQWFKANLRERVR